MLHPLPTRHHMVSHHTGQDVNHSPPIRFASRGATPSLARRRGAPRSRGPALGLGEHAPTVREPRRASWLTLEQRFPTRRHQSA